MRGRYNKFHLQRMEELYKKGYTTIEIAEAAGCAKSYVRTVLVNRGVKMRPRYRHRVEPVPQTTIKKAGRLYAKGMTLAELGVKLGCSQGYARSLVHQSGVTIRPRGVRPSNP